MRRLFLLSNLILLSFFCFAQQNLPDTIIWNIPDNSSAKTYQIQVGAYKLEVNSENAMQQLRKNALIPESEKYLDFTRVMIKWIPADQVMNFLSVLKQAGFDEVIIREDAPASISGKWEINSPDSAYSSFEFNHDNHYIAVENNETQSARFGEYTIPQKDVISMENLGVVRIEEDSDTGVTFSFSPIEEPEKETRFSAAKAEVIAVSPELDLLCRTWKVVNSTDEKYIGLYLFISNAGTYFFTTPDGELNNLSHWRWYDDSKEEFEYTHDEWAHYGRAEIFDLTINSLEVFDPGFFNDIKGYSKGTLSNFHELVPVND